MTSAAVAPGWKRYLAPKYLAGKLVDMGPVWCLSFSALFPLAVFLRVLLRALKPLLHIRFGRIGSERLGTFAWGVEMYLCERDAGVQASGTLDLWYYYDREGYALSKPVRPNQAVSIEQLDLMVRRVIHVSNLARFLDRLNRMLPPGSDDFIVPARPANSSRRAGPRLWAGRYPDRRNPWRGST